MMRPGAVTLVCLPRSGANAGRPEPNQPCQLCGPARQLEHWAWPALAQLPSLSDDLVCGPHIRPACRGDLYDRVSGSARACSSRHVGVVVPSGGSSVWVCLRVVDTWSVAGQSLISWLNAGWSRIGSRSESSFAFPRNSSDMSIARRRCSSASVVRPVRLSQQARL
jgi:hypothetical protein